MLEIPREILDAVITQAQEGFQLEVCGIMGGTGNRVASRYPMTNTDASNEHFMMDPKEQFAVVKAMRAAGEEMLVIYHSHPESPARPSQEDIRLALTPNVCHLIVSLENREEPVAKAFRIAAGVVEPVEINII
ncbi:M67 family metallopeptidase [Geomonas subterranea]|uniref:M67 family metallopeptidase n=1 Tax=Geomonas subterranea TaxID=2847989 RepID=A0ABX8LLB8_9BACT|nr:M67 family metallopeptidase [Geomonas subterranea]QXE92141.1 M67 family metallopeptidase [Geomonas subterranea]QXM09761.1 M67 family metallopeptidase [Geomonas subterranea]